MRICITGASKGLGFALCRELCARGHEVWAVSRSERPADLPRPCRWSTVDIANYQEVTSWRNEQEIAQWVPDSMVLNAGVLREDMEKGIDLHAVRETLDVNLRGAFQCIEAFLPIMRQTRGSFVAVSSTSAIRPSRRSASYSASKAGISMAFRSLRLRYGSDGVRFAVVTLGPIRTDMWEGSANIFVPPADRAARTVASFLLSRRNHCAYPFWTTLFLRMTLWLPDAVFDAASRSFFRVK